VSHILRIFMLIVVLIALSSLGYIYYQKTSPIKAKQVSSTSSASISVSKTVSPELDTNTTATSTPPAAANSQTSTASNLQSNVDVNDPSLANNSLVKSVNTGVSQ